ncbi:MULTISPECIES: antitoxin [Pseudanabaena]|jgi:signal transduction histidine kinase|uniref:antitoxin n=1 Tax=Pseudanabaena TaxID=1152 RepID=UPI002479F6CE|nr:MULTISPECIES: antitoxin [Pseudanabaena]MEA5486927.1 antitoxin [Pseudanabaena sp. CCNP1317]WGS75054.1 antitoxin [Pseudanabaena galeata CCNP1313]
MANISVNASSNVFSKTLTTKVPVTLMNNIKKIFLFAVALSLVLMMQVSFFNENAIASPLASIGSQVDKLSDTSKTLAKDTGNRAKDLANNLKTGTKENVDKAKDMAKNGKGRIADGVDKTKEMAGDRANEAQENTQALSDKASNKVEEAIDSVKNFLGQ